MDLALYKRCVSFLYSTSPALIAVLGLSACGSEPAFRCADVAFETCDIREAFCQVRIYDQMRCLRGTPELAQRPEVITMDPAEVRAILLAPPADAGVEAAEEAVQVERALSLLGLIETRLVGDTEAQADQLLGGLLGFYSGETKTIVILDWPGEPMDDVRAAATLGHEFLHGLQDQQYDLGKYREDRSGSFDLGLGGLSFLEGEASVFEWHQASKLHGQQPEKVNWGPIFDEATSGADTYVEEVGSPFATASLLFPYTYGLRGVGEAWLEGGSDAIADLRRREDLRSRDFLRGDFGEVRLPGTASAAAGMEVLGSETLGAWVLHGFISHVLGLESSPGLARRWRGDTLSMHAATEGDEVGAVWSVRWAHAEHAQQFESLVNSSAAPAGGFWHAVQEGLVTHLVAASGAGPLEGMLSAVSGRNLLPIVSGADRGADAGAVDEEPTALRNVLERWLSACHRR